MISPCQHQTRSLLLATTTNTTHVDSRITTISMAVMDTLADIEKIVHDLKVDRDTWHAVALQYRSAFEAQKLRFHELQDVCFATQAELENERVQQRRLRAMSSRSGNYFSTTFDGAEDPRFDKSFGTATIHSPTKPVADRARNLSNECANPLFKRVQECAAQKNYGTALVEVERLLRGPLSSKARAEGLLLKSNVLRASGPEELFDALAACSEAVELCDRISELENFLPRIQCQRSRLYQELRMLRDDKEAFSTASDDGLLPTEASDIRESYDDELDMLRCAKRRSGFDENRTMEGLLAQLEGKGYDVRHSWLCCGSISC